MGQTAVKKVYATVMLIKEEDVSDVELKRVLKQGADEKVKNTVQAAMDKLSTGEDYNNDAEKLASVKAAIKGSLGKDEDASDIKVQEYLQTASVGRVKDVMLACGKDVSQEEKNNVVANR